MITKFELGGVTWDVIIDNERMDELACIGYCENATNTITLTTAFKGDLLKEDNIELTLLHEVTHAILDTLGECKLSNNEKFVNSFSTLLHQYLKTKR